MECFLDMDGVVTDFVKGACLLHGRQDPFKENPANLGNYYVENMLGLTTEEFFSGMEEEFWANLEPMHDWLEILYAVESYFGDGKICILTSPTNNHGCMEGKRRWINRWLPEYSRRFLMGPPKEFCASPTKVLIDDSDEKVMKFNKAGGIGILVPRPWNSMYHYSKPAVKHIIEQLQSV